VVEYLTDEADQGGSMRKIAKPATSAQSDRGALLQPGEPVPGFLSRQRGDIFDG
jgi:hypothetical protein